jgi:hypothetical protein
MDKPGGPQLENVRPFLRQFGFLQLIQMKVHYTRLLSRDDFPHMKHFWTKGLEILNEVIDEILPTTHQEACDRPPDMD